MSVNNSRFPIFSSRHGNVQFNACVAALVCLGASALALGILTLSPLYPLLKIIGFVLAFGFFPAFLLCFRSRIMVSITDVFAYSLIGILLASTIDALLLYVGQHSGWVLTAIILPLSLLGLTRCARATVSLELKTRDAAWLAVLVFLFAFQVVFSLIWMASGAFSPAFINVDAPFYLSQTHAMVTESLWPVESLNVSGVRIGYHYGAQNAAALLVRFTDLPAHTALFGVVCGLVMASITAAALSAARRLKGARHIWLPLGLLMLFALDMEYVWDRLNLLGAPIDAIPHPGGMVGAAAVMICLYAIADRENQNLRLLALAVFVTSFSRTTDFLALIMGLGLFAGIKFLLDKKIAPIIYFSITAVASFAVIFTLTYESSGGAIAIAPGSYLFVSDSWRLIVKITQDLSRTDIESAIPSLLELLKRNMLIIAGALILAAFGLSRRTMRWDILAFALPPLVFLNVFVFEHPGFIRAPDEPERDLSHALSNMMHGNIYMWWGLLVAYMGAHDRIRPALSARVAYGALCLLAATAIGIKGLQIVELVRNPTDAYEYADNRDIADALSPIPVEGSLLVTNDLRYPAQNYARDNRQHQLSALFGHRNFASVLRYVPTPDYLERKRLNALLAEEVWSPELDEAAARYGWTHYVVHKAAPHPKDIPLPQIYENEAYVVYRFPPS